MNQIPHLLHNKIKENIMNINELRKALIPVMTAGYVPFIRGLHGIGKSEIVSKVAEELEFHLGKEVTLHEVDLSHIKEGELTGMPVTRKTEDGYMVNDYTIHHLFFEAIRETEQGYAPVIFFDELNRADSTVFNEIMPIILARRIQEITLPPEIKIICAGNPEDVRALNLSEDYAVRTMDPALKDRFFIFDLESDPKAWLTWAVNNKINSDIIEFISEFPANLHNLKSNGEIHPTPRGWTMVSNVIKEIHKQKLDEETEKNILVSVSSGKIGFETTMNFINFLGEKTNPTLKPTDFFKVSEEVRSKNIEKLQNETLTRSHVAMMRIIAYLSELKTLTQKDNEIFVEILKAIPNDLMVGTVFEITNNHPVLLNKLTKNSEFMKTAISVRKHLI